MIILVAIIVFGIVVVGVLGDCITTKDDTSEQSPHFNGENDKFTGIPDYQLRRRRNLSSMK
jgi:hypothetical protein